MFLSREKAFQPGINAINRQVTQLEGVLLSKQICVDYFFEKKDELPCLPLIVTKSCFFDQFLYKTIFIFMTTCLYIIC